MYIYIYCHISIIYYIITGLYQGPKGQYVYIYMYVGLYRIRYGKQCIPTLPKHTDLLRLPKNTGCETIVTPSETLGGSDINTHHHWK